LDRIKTQMPIDAVINTAAYTAVDLAEKEKDLAWRINAQAPGKIAQWCARHEIPLVHFSTDYVFSGEGNRPWQENDIPSPLNTYGQTKLEGEKSVMDAQGKFLLFRTSWVYDAHGKNFVKTMLQLGQTKETLKVVADQTGAPTYATDLAKGAWSALVRATQMNPFPSGIYHLCNAGETTWYGFAKAIFEGAHQLKIPLYLKTVEPIPSSEYPTPAKRPKNSRLNTSQAETTFAVRLPPWQDSLHTCLQEILQETHDENSQR